MGSFNDFGKSSVAALVGFPDQTNRGLLCLQSHRRASKGVTSATEGTFTAILFLNGYRILLRTDRVSCRPSTPSTCINRITPEMNMPHPETSQLATILEFSALALESSIQTRAKTNPATVAKYAERMKAGDKFPPLIVYLVDGKYLLADGFHRMLAARQLGLTALPAEIREGTRQDFVTFAVGANAGHGLPQTNADKRRAVELALAELADQSDHTIAQACKVSQPFVGKVRKQLKTIISSGTRTGRDGKTRKLPVRKPAQSPSAPRSEAVVEGATPYSTNGVATAHVNEAPVSDTELFDALFRDLAAQIDHALTKCPRPKLITFRHKLASYLSGWKVPGSSPVVRMAKPPADKVLP